MSRRIAPIAVLLILLSVVAGYSLLGAQQQGDEMDGLDEETRQRMFLREDFSELIELEQDHDDAIVGLEVIFYEQEKVIFNYGIVGDKRLEFNSDPKRDDDQLLHKMVECYLSRPLRHVIGTGFLEGGRPIATVGKVTVKTKKGREFFFGITQVGFTLNSEEYDMRRVFYSWGLARVLDDVLYRERRIHMPYKLIVELSGIGDEVSSRDYYLRTTREWHGLKPFPDDYPKETDPKRNWLLEWHSDGYVKEYLSYIRSETAIGKKKETKGATKRFF